MRLVKTTIFLLSLGLFIITIYGHFTPLSASKKAISGITHKQGLIYNDSLYTKQQLDNYQHIDPYIITELFAASIISYWPAKNKFDPDIIHRISENWILFFLSYGELLGHKLLQFPKEYRFSRMERFGYKRTLEKGVGLCSQTSLALMDYLKIRGINSEVIGFKHHTILQANINDKDYILDAERNIVIEANIDDIKQNPQLIYDAYSTKYDASFAHIITDHLTDDITPVYHVHIIYFVFILEILKWLIPLSLMIWIAPLLYRDYKHHR